MNDSLSYIVAPGMKEKLRIPIIGRMSGNITSDEIIDIVCEYYNLDKKIVMGSCRKRELVECRHTCMLFLRAIKRLSYKQISEQVGNRDHTTVIHGLRHIEDLMENEESMRYDIDAMRERIRNKMRWE